MEEKHIKFTYKGKVVCNRYGDGEEFCLSEIELQDISQFYDRLCRMGDAEAHLKQYCFNTYCYEILSPEEIAAAKADFETRWGFPFEETLTEEFLGDLATDFAHRWENDYDADTLWDIVIEYALQERSPFEEEEEAYDENDDM